MNRAILTIETNTPLTATTWRMTLLGDTSAITAPGQFVNLALEGKFLRRPLSVCDWEPGRLTLVYKVVGDGTAQLSRMTHGQTLDVLLGLGNGYDLTASGEKPLLLGGGVGVPPLYGLCKRLIAGGKRPAVVLGFNTAEEIFFEAFQLLRGWLRYRQWGKWYLRRGRADGHQHLSSDAGRGNH